MTKFTNHIFLFTLAFLLAHSVSADPVIPCTADCVFPGDGNNDNNVGNFDILLLGLGYGESGTPRPNASPEWEGQAAPNWGMLQKNGLDFKHLDCDGNGVINELDVSIVLANYRKTYTNIIPLRNNEPRITVELAQDTFILNGQQGEVAVGGDLLFGEDLNSVDDVYGLAFTIQFDNSYVKPNSIAVDFHDNSWLTDNSQTLSITRVDYSQGKIDVALVRTDKTSRSGAGPLASFGVVITDDIIERSLTANIQFVITDVKVIDKDGNEIDVDVKPTIATVKLDYLSGTAAGPTLNEQLHVFPNPTSDKVFYELKDHEVTRVDVYNLMGQQVSATVFESRNCVEVGDLNPGTYLLALQTEEGTAHRKIVVR